VYVVCMYVYMYMCNVNVLCMWYMCMCVGKYVCTYVCMCMYVYSICIVYFFYSCPVHFDTIKVFYLPTDAQ